MDILIGTMAEARQAGSDHGTGGSPGGAGAAGASVRNRGASELPLAGRRVLVVEDEALVALYLSDVLEEAGAEVVGPAHCLREAMALVDADDFDAALMDVNLAGEASWPAIEAMGRVGKPFVVLSGNAVGEQARAHGAREVLTKPARPEEVVGALAAAAAGPVAGNA